MIVAPIYAAAQVSFPLTQGGTYETPSEEIVGSIHLSELVLKTTASPPKKVVIYPAMFRREGKTEIAVGFQGCIEGDGVVEFFHRLAKPTRIGVTDEACPSIILSWDECANEPLLLRARILVDADRDIVRLRMCLNSEIYPVTDFLYEKQGFAEWLKQYELDVHETE